MRSGLTRALRHWAERDGRGYPDWAMRYVPIVRALTARGLEGKRVLEIGANANGFARFAAMPVIAVDLHVAHLLEARTAPGVIPSAADIAHLPFPDASFDVVLCVDTFEHLPAPVRDAAAREILRVLRQDGVAVVTFPAGAASEAAEATVRAAYARHTRGGKLRWLEEHVDVGLPEPEAVSAAFHTHGGGTVRVTRKGNANIRVWIWVWRVLMCGWPGRGNAFAQVFLRAITPLLVHAHAQPCYRSALWIERKPD
jgi:SAM-dependent methyltransferase